MKASRTAAAVALSLAALAGCHKSESSEPPAPASPPRELPPQTVLEHEPNDLQHVQTLPARAIVRGELAPEKGKAAGRAPAGTIDDDWYRVEAGKGATLALHVELTQAEPVPSANPTPGLGPLDAQLEVTDRDRNRLVLAHATAGEPALLPAVACAESCFLHVWGGQPAAYTLTVLGAAPQEGMELEPNDRAIDANPLPAGKSVQGTLGRPDDEDWYRLSASARPGQFLRVELTGVPGVRPLLELRALPDGALLASFAASSEGAGISLRDISLAGEQIVPEPPRLRPLDGGSGPGDAGAGGDADAAQEGRDGNAAHEGNAVAIPADAGLLDAATHDGGLLDAGADSNGTMTSHDADDVARAEGQRVAGRLPSGAESQPVLPANPASPASANGAANAAGADPASSANPAPDSGGGENVRDPSLPRAGELPGGALADGGLPAPGALSNRPQVGSSMQMKSFGPNQVAGIPGEAGAGVALSLDGGAPGASDAGAQAGQSANGSQAPNANAFAPRESSTQPQGDGGAQAGRGDAGGSGSGAAGGTAEVQVGYYLVVKSAPLTGEKRSPRGANPRATYTLSTALEAGPGDLEQEPNDDPSRATWLGATRTGYLSPAGDADWYRVRNEGKSVLRAEVTGLSRADLELAIFAPPARPGDKPALLARANEGGVREGELLPAVGIDGDALVLVQCAQRELDGAKVRDCEDRDSPYTLSISLAADDGALEREPNDDLDHAQPVTVPAKITGTLWPKRDVDVFQFSLEAPRTLSFRLSAVRGVDTMLTLRELKQRKGKLAGEVIGTADAAHGDGPEEILSVPLKPGSYSIEVASPRKDGSATQPYTLQLQ